MIVNLEDINRSDLSRATGIDMAHISRICNRKAKPSLTLALKIADHLKITVEDLCEILGIGPDDNNDNRTEVVGSGGKVISDFDRYL